jgi:hypothetical protein
MANFLPSAIRAQPGNADNTNIEVYGSDLHDLGDDGIFFYDTAGFRVEGSRIWNVNEKTDDPGQTLGNSDDWFHNDGLQTSGGVSDVHVQDSWLGQKIQWAAEKGKTNSNTEFSRLWLAGSTTYGNINGISSGGKILSTTQRDIKVFKNGQAPSGAGYDADFDNFRTDFVDNSQRAIWPQTYFAAGQFEVSASNITTGVPVGMNLTDGLISDINQIRDYPTNPANLWRIAHPYVTYAVYLKLLPELMPTTAPAGLLPTGSVPAVDAQNRLQHRSSEVIAVGNAAGHVLADHGTTSPQMIVGVSALAGLSVVSLGLLVSPFVSPTSLIGLQSCRIRNIIRRTFLALIRGS